MRHWSQHLLVDRRQNESVDLDRTGALNENPWALVTGSKCDISHDGSMENYGKLVKKKHMIPHVCV